MSSTGRLSRVHAQEAMARWLKKEMVLTHFVTLTTHNSEMGEIAMKRKLKAWDARVNREFYGPKWAKHRDELIWFFAYLEKPGVNPHWHLLLRFVGRWNSSLETERAEFPEQAEHYWKLLVPSGTVDVRQIERVESRTVEEYAVKELSNVLQYDNFIMPDEFRR